MMLNMLFDIVMISYITISQSLRYCSGVARLGKLVWLIDRFNRIFDCSIRVSRSFCNISLSTQQAFGRAWVLPGPPNDYLNNLLHYY